MTMHSQEWITCWSCSVALCCFIDHMVLAQHPRDIPGLQAVVQGSVVPYVTLKRGSSCQHVVLSPADWPQRGAAPPARSHLYPRQGYPSSPLQRSI